MKKRSSYGLRGFSKSLISLAIVLLILAVMTPCLSSCGGAGGSRKLTVMIYMIGSDLESKSGMASMDMDEITDSGVSQRDVNVVICAGGTEKWRNDSIGAENNTILQLKGGKFKTVETWDSASMGESSTLTNFLSYCCENYPSDEYALILWDHGAGPVMGYGVDTLHEKDGLSLPEMRDALAASPFGPDNKLAWVGFDACLMSSVELACIWADYADYLIASQEVEPGYGWNYAFLKDAGEVSTPELTGEITSSYLQSCLDYYTELGYEPRDTTLACMDLSKVPEVTRAVNELFGKAAKDVGRSYNRLASRRVSTRALGRATTGSEYDLVDLNDAAEQLETYYPEEAAAVKEALGGMITSNATNTDALCGVSLYYPFFNKYYYENLWAQEYEALDVLPGYFSYLKAYGKRWLGTDMMADASKAEPVMNEPGVYTLQLSPEQAESFAEAKFYVLMHYTGDVYIPIITSPEVTYDERKQTLTATFDGNVLYATNDTGYYGIPAAKLLSTDGGRMHYSVDCTMSNRSVTGKGSGNDDEFAVTRGWFHLAVDPENKTVGTCSLLEKDVNEEVSADTLTQGKAEELDISEWSQYLFLYPAPQVVSRNDNGIILPADQWSTLDSFSFHEFAKEDGLHFEYAPLESGDYSLMFEITDTQNNSYCSEPTRIDSSQIDFRDAPSGKAHEVTWEEGDGVTLLEKDGLKLRMVAKEEYGEIAQTLEVTNNTDAPVEVSTFGDEVVANGRIDCGYGSVSVNAEPGETTTAAISSDGEPVELSFYWGTAAYNGYLDKIDTAEFCVDAWDTKTGKTIWEKEKIKVKYSDKTRPVLTSRAQYFDDESESVKEHYAHPFRGALAEEQSLYNDEDIEVRLIFFGADEDGSDDNLIRITNKTDRPMYATFHYIAVNGICMDSVIGGKIMPKCTYYTGLSMYRIDDYNIKEIGDFKACISFTDNSSMSHFGMGKYVWCDIKLKEHGRTDAEFPETGKILYEKDGIKISQISDGLIEGQYGTPVWQLALENNSGKDISLRMTEVSEDGGEPQNQWKNQSVGMDWSSTGAHQKKIVEITPYNDNMKTVSFKLQIMDFNATKVLDTSDETITLER